MKIKKVITLLDEMDWLFQINNFDRSVIISTKPNKENEDVPLEIEFIESYQQIVITIYPYFSELSKTKQRKAILHELCHTITIPSKKAMCDLLSGKLITEDRIHDINEMETSKIENILDGILSNRMKYAKKAYDKYLEEK